MIGPCEIELKLELDRQNLAKLKRDPLLRTADEATDRLVSRYFDTADRGLHKAGYTLRVRHSGNGNIQTVKQEAPAAAGLFQRPEWERPIEGRRPTVDCSDGPLAALIGGRKLARAFTTDVRRSVRDFVSNGSRIEIALDEGTIRAGSSKLALCEIELELKGGAPEPLFALARAMNEVVPLRLGVRSKAERGYDLTEADPADALKADRIELDPLHDARGGFAAIAAACIRHFRLNEPLLLATGEAETLHQARVALRRLRSAFSLFKPLLEGDANAGRLGDELRWLAAKLGAVRDLDVFIPHFEGDGADRLVEARAAAMEEARCALESARARKLMIDLAEWLAIGAWRMQPADPICATQNVALFAGTLLDRHRRRLQRRGRHLAKLDDHRRHRVRIEAKKVRYATEFFASLWDGGKARRRRSAFLSALEELQDHLGEINDRTAAAAILAKLGLSEAGISHRESTHALLDRAEDAFSDLVDAKPFWRG